MKKQILCVLLLAGLVLAGGGCIVPHPYHGDYGYYEPGYNHYDHGYRHHHRHHGHGHHHGGGGLHVHRR